MSELLKINVNEHTERKGNLTYLSWAWAWAEVLKIDPKATWRLHRFGTMDELQPCMWIGETAMVHVTVTINDIQRDCVLPVMDNRNKAIKNPDAFAINTAIMRCLAKAIAMHGLGLYIYAGEDLPEGEPEQPKVVAGVIKATDGIENHIPEDRRAELDEMALNMIEAAQNGNEMFAIAAFYGLTENDEKVYIWKMLAAESKLRATIKRNNPNQQAA